MSRNTNTGRNDPATLLLDLTTPGDNSPTEAGTVPLPVGLHRVQFIANVASDPPTSFDGEVTFTGIEFEWLTLGNDSLALSSEADSITNTTTAIIRVTAGGTAAVVLSTITDDPADCAWLGAVTVERVTEQ